MYQIDNSSVAGTLPASTASGTPGFFTDGNPGAAIPATVLPAEFMNMLMLEMLGVLTAAGVTPSKANNNQLASAINTMVQGGANVYTLDTGVANAYVVSYSPAITGLADGLILHFLAKNTSTGASTLAVDKNTARPLINLRYGVMKAGQIGVGSLCTVQYVSTLDSFVLLNVSGIAVPSTLDGYGITDAYTKAQTDSLIGAQTKVVTTPVVSGSSSVTTGTVVALTATATSLLTGGSIASFTWTLPDGTTSTTAATSNSATKSVTATGSIGTSYVVKVMATDNAGNTSQVATKSIAITNHAAPTAPTAITVAATVFQASTGNTLTVSGATASDGATVTYSLSQSGSVAVAFSKTTGIAPGEQVTFTAPTVAADTPITISAVAVDSMGGVSPSLLTNVTVSAAPSVFGVAYGGGFYMGRFTFAGKIFALVVAPKSAELFLSVQTSGISVGALSNIDGLTNSTLIAAAAAKQANGITCAATACLAYRGGGYTDWHMPAFNQLELMFRNGKPTTATNANTGNGVNPDSVPVGAAYTQTNPAQTTVTNFKSGGSDDFARSPQWSGVVYASSTESDSGNTKSQSFDVGSQSAYSKTLAALVRPVRMVQIG